MRISFITLGCPKNQVDSGRMAAAVRSTAYDLAEEPEDADVVVLNTCAFIREAVEESITVALDLAAWKNGCEDRFLIVAGCMPSRYGDELAAALPEVDAFLPVASEADLTAVIEALTGVASLAGPIPELQSDGPFAYVMVSDGCDKRCSYCTIPSIRGPYRSRPLADVLAESSSLVRSGARELVLVGQDISAWGKELEGAGDLADVVSAVALTPGLDRLRLMYVQPDGVTDRLLETMAADPAVCRYLDLPLQHASRDVLRRMGRSGDADAHLTLLARIRAVMPDIVLRTSLIAGFPGETEEDLSLLEDFLEEARFDYAGVFAYSPEDGTPAAKMRPRVPVKVRAERANRLRSVADRIGSDKAAAMIGRSVAVLVEGVDEEGRTFGRSSGQAPDVDGVVSLDGEFAPGTLVTVRIVDSLGYDLIGRPEDA